MNDTVIGILGGMGPESTAELLLRITRLTPAAVEQDHFRVVIDSNPKIPNRTEALLSGRLQPVIDALVDTAANLERAGVSVIGMPCNTAHAFLPDLRDAVEVPIVDMVEATAARVLQELGEGTVVGVLATDGTLRTRLYHEALADLGLEAVGPGDPGVQNAVMDTLETVKLHGVVEAAQAPLAAAIRDVASRGATALIAGCTEVSLILKRFPPKLRWFDPLTVLAEALVKAGVATAQKGIQ
jgi:aspartate racemase